MLINTFMIDPIKTYRHKITGEEIKQHVISSLHVIEIYLESGYKGDDYSIWGYVDGILAELGVKTLPEAFEIVEMVE